MVVWSVGRNWAQVPKPGAHTSLIMRHWLSSEPSTTKPLPSVVGASPMKAAWLAWGQPVLLPL